PRPGSDSRTDSLSSTTHSSERLFITRSPQRSTASVVPRCNSSSVLLLCCRASHDVSRRGTADGQTDTHDAARRRVATTRRTHARRLAAGRSYTSTTAVEPPCAAVSRSFPFARNEHLLSIG